MKQNLFIPSHLVSHERVLTPTCHVWMCGSERVWDQSLSSRSQMNAPHSRWLTCSRAWPALPCKWHGTARHGLTPCDGSSKRRSVSAMKHAFSLIRANMEFVLALVSARFCRPATDNELQGFGLHDLWPLLRGHSRLKPTLSRHYWNKIIWQVTRRAFGEVYQVKCSLMLRCLRCNWKIYTTSCSNLVFRRQAGMRVIGPLIKSASSSEWQVPRVHRSKGVKLLIGAENREST